MATDSSSDIHDFYRYLGHALQSAGPLPTPEEALDAWRSQHPESDDVLAVQEALDDMAAGDRGLPLEEFDRQFRARNGIPDDV